MRRTRGSPLLRSAALCLALLLGGWGLASPFGLPSLEEARSEFGALDAELDRLHQLLLALLPEERLADLQEEHRAWLAYREAFALRWASLQAGAEATAEDEPTFWEGKTIVTEMRMDYLQGWLLAFSPWDGFWTDGLGGVLLIAQQPDGHFAFAIQVVRGASLHTGELQGLALVEGETALFRAWSEFAEEEIVLRFRLDGPLLHLSEDGAARFYHGAAASFDGVYLRRGPMVEPERNELRRLMVEEPAWFQPPQP